jgi:hypothetical protein
VPPTTHTLLSSNDTSIAAKRSMAVPPRCLGPTRSNPVHTTTVKGRHSDRKHPALEGRPISHLRLCGPGEWLVERHGTRARRSWRKLHLGVDAETGQIVASALTGRDVDDASQLGPLLDQVAEPVASLTADGAYDQESVYADVAQRHPDAAVVVPPRATAVPSATAESAPTRRDRHLRLVAEHGRMGWQKRSGCNTRARAEAAIARWKQVIGDGLRSRRDERRATEVEVAVHALNRMLELGRPISVRIA